VPVYTISCRNNVSIFNFSILLDEKVNPVDALRRLRLPLVFKSTEKKIKENREFLRKIGFRQNRF